MKRITYWAMSTITALVLLLGYHTSTSSQSPAVGSSAASPASPDPSSSSSSGATSAGSSSAPTAGATSSTSTGEHTVTGDVAQTRWGPVQVRLTITAGKVTAVDVLQQPDGNGMDEQINAQALPILVSETLKTQSAKIDMVSGATYTSTGYLTSLQSALDKAGL